LETPEELMALAINYVSLCLNPEDGVIGLSEKVFRELVE
jgi:hypothetical protein